MLHSGNSFQEIQFSFLSIDVEELEDPTNHMENYNGHQNSSQAPTSYVVTQAMNKLMLILMPCISHETNLCFHTSAAHVFNALSVFPFFPLHF